MDWAPVTEQKPQSPRTGFDRLCTGVQKPGQASMDWSCDKTQAVTSAPVTSVSGGQTQGASYLVTGSSVPVLSIPETPVASLNMGQVVTSTPQQGGHLNMSQVVTLATPSQVGGAGVFLSNSSQTSSQQMVLASTGPSISQTELINNQQQFDPITAQQQLQVNNQQQLQVSSQQQLQVSNQQQLQVSSQQQLQVSNQQQLQASNQQQLQVSNQHQLQVNNQQQLQVGIQQQLQVESQQQLQVCSPSQQFQSMNSQEQHQFEQINVQRQSQQYDSLSSQQQPQQQPQFEPINTQQQQQFDSIGSQQQFGQIANQTQLRSDQQQTQQYEPIVNQQQQFQPNESQQQQQQQCIPGPPPVSVDEFIQSSSVQSTFSSYDPPSVSGSASNPSSVEQPSSANTLLFEVNIYH